MRKKRTNKGGNPRYFSSEQDVANFFDGIIMPLEEKLNDFRFGYDKKFFKYFVPEEGKEHHQFDGKDTLRLHEVLNKFLDEYLNNLPKVPLLQRTDTEVTTLNSMKPFDESPFDLESVTIGRLDLKRKITIDQYILDEWYDLDVNERKRILDETDVKNIILDPWMNESFVKKFVKFACLGREEAWKQYSEGKISIGENCDSICYLLLYDGWEGFKEQRRIFVKQHPFYDFYELTEITSMSEEKIRSRYLNTALYRELNKRSNELFRYVLDDNEFFELVFGVKEMPLDFDIKKHKSIYKCLIRFTEIAEFWEEVIVHKMHFKREDYGRWQIWRKELFQESLFVQTYFDMQSKHHSQELREDLGFSLWV